MTQTTSQRFVRSGQHAAVHALVALQLFTGIAQAAELTPTTGGVTLDQAANGVPIVNIAKPNGAGISHNRYSRFNVGAQGLILNNSAQPVNTQLGGYITGNANLGAGSARLILNEVTAANPSQLKGYMEVAGQRAGVVVANPYGITCDGCGFINTSRATLATGTPRWRSDGTLERFDVQQGVLRIEGAGLNADNTDGLALYARTLELNAALYANALEVVTGANSIDAETGVATAQAGTGVVPAYAIDSSMLGGMYAGTITLVGTEAGVGMRLAAPVAALTGQLEIRNNGDVRLVRTSAQSDMTVQAQGGVELAALTTVGGDATFTVEGVLNNRSLVEVTGNLQLTAGELSNANGTLQAGRNLTLNLAVFDRAQSGGRIAAGEQLTLQTVGDIRFNGDEFATPGALSVLSLAGDILIDSRVVAGGDTVLRSQQLMLGETAVLVGQGALSIAAQDMTNQGIVYGRDRLTLQVENVLTNGGGETLPAALLSEGDIHIARADGGMLSALDNVASQIESRNGAIEIAAEQLRNINLGWSTRSYDLAPTYTYTPNAGTWANYYGTGISGTSGMHAYRYQRITRHHEVEQGMRGNIVAAGDITIAATTVENDRSTISAGDHLEITADNIYNTGTELTDTTRVMLSDRWHTCEKHTDGNTTCNNHEAIYRRADEPGDTVVIPAVIEGRTVTLKGNVGVVNCSPGEAGEPGSKCTGVSPGGSLGGMTGPWATTPLAQPGTLLPASGLFQLNHDPNHPYLIETDPALNTYTGFLGSAYLLSHLDGWAPDMTQRRLGDSYYELMLIREALLASTGSRFLDPAIADEKAQFEYLMQNAIAASEALHLSPGIALSREQIDALQSDIVWMEERVVADQKVLVPVVYLAQGSSRLLREGSVIGGGSLAVEAGSFVNTGLLRAEDNLLIRAEEDLLNRTGSLQAGGTLIAQSGGDFRNESGQLSGENVLVLAGGDITHQTDSEGHAWQAGAAASTYTNVGATASVTASGQVVQIAGGDIRLQGAAVSGDNVAMVAGGDIAMETERVEQSRSFSGADWQMAEEQVRHLQTEVEALNEIRLVAGADLEAIAASPSFSAIDWQQAEEAVRHLQMEVEALQELRLKVEGDIILSAAWLRGGNVALQAGNNILLQSVTESDHTEVHSQQESSREDSSSDSVSDSRRQLGTLIEAAGNTAAGNNGNIVLNAHVGSILVDASAVVGTGDITVKAGGDINVLSGINTESYSLVTEREGLTRFSNHQEGYISQTLAQAGFASGGNLSLDSHGEINLAAAGLKAGALLQIGAATVRTDADGNALKDADGRLVIDRGTVSNINDFAVTLTNKSWSETQSGFTGPLEELVNVASLLTSNFNFILTAGQLDLPAIETGSRSSAQRETQTAATSSFGGSDILLSATDRVRLEGTQLLASGAPDAEGNYAGGNVNVLAGTIDLLTAESTSFEQMSSAKQTSQALGMSTSTTEVQLAGLQITDRSSTVATLSTTHQGVGVSAANISLIADDAVGMVAANLAADAEGGNIVIDARKIDISGVQDTSTTTTEERIDTKTLTVGVRNAFVDATLAAKAFADALEAIKDADEALSDAEARVATGALAPAALEDYRRNRDAAIAQAAYLELAMGAAAMTAAGTTATGGFYVSGSAQEESSLTTTTSTVGIWQGSNLSASDIRLSALDSLSIIGSNITADSGTLDAGSIAVKAGSNTSSQSSHTATTSLGVTASSSGTGSNALTQAGTLGISAGSSHAQSQAQATQYVNSHLDFGTLTSTSKALTLVGAVIEADTAIINTDSLTITSLQDSSSSNNSSESHSAGISLSDGGLGGLSGVNGAIGGGSGYSRSQMTGELSGIIVRNGAVSTITAEDTILTGGIIANAVRDESGLLVDQGGLNFVTGTLVTHDLFDYSVSEQKGFNFGLSISLRPGETLKEGTTSPPQGASEKQAASGASPSGNPLAAGSIQPGTLTLGVTHSGHRTEGTTFATIGQGNVMVQNDALTGQDSLAGVNRDLHGTSIVTLDQDTHALDASASVDLRPLTEAGRKQIAKEQERLGKNYQIIGDSIGEGVQSAIEVGVGLFEEGEAARVAVANIEKQIGRFGIIPTGLNNGGLAFGQLPVLLTADDINQKRIVAAHMDSDYMNAHPELEWVPITETEGFYLLPEEKRAELKNFMVSTVAVNADPSIATYQNATTGMLNTEALALYNAYLQTGTNLHPENGVFTLNYNPTREFFADGLESAIDKIATSDLLGLLDTVRPFSFLSTTVADQTGEFMKSVMMAQGDKGANFACHSQGCLLTYSGLLSVGEFSGVDKLSGDKERNFTFNMYGSAVNNVSFFNYLESETMQLSSATVNKGDYVGQSIGGNRSTYIFSKEMTPNADLSKTQYNPIRDFANKLNLWNAALLFTAASPHSTYQCTKNCTSEKE